MTTQNEILKSESCVYCGELGRWHLGWRAVICADCRETMRIATRGEKRALELEYPGLKGRMEG
jgi:hypothetical protein